MAEQTQRAPLTSPRPVADPLATGAYCLAALALALAPTQLTVPLRGVPIHPAEPLLAVAALLWFIQRLRDRDWSSLPPLPLWGVVATIGLGVCAPRDGFAWGVLKEAVQAILYLLVAVTVFRATLTTPARIRGAAFALLATTTLAVALGVAQRVTLARHYQPDPTKRLVFATAGARSETLPPGAADGDQFGYWDADGFHPCGRFQAYLTAQIPAQVCSTFGHWSDHGYHPSRTAYGTFLALVLPLALALGVTATRRWVRVWLALLGLGAAASLLAGFVLLPLLVGLLVTAWALGARVLQGTLLAIALFLGVAWGVGGLTRSELLQEPFRPLISAQEATFRYADGTRHLKKFWGEQQAALNLLRATPLLGVGAGQYQARIANGYDLLGAIDSQRLESDAHNGYLLTAASTGLLGLIALLACLGAFWGRMKAVLRAGPVSPELAAVCGGFVALVAVLCVTYPFIRGLSLVIAALLALLWNAPHAGAPRIEAEDGDAAA
jgi:O-antigen ligase